MKIGGYLGERNYENKRISKGIMLQKEISKIRDFRKGFKKTQNIIGEMSRKKM